MISFSTTILKFSRKGEKTGWTYIEIPADIAEQISPGNKRSFRVKGKLDNFLISQTAMVPMGKGNFILPLNTSMRKGTGKKHRDILEVKIEIDNSPVLISSDLLECLDQEPKALDNFKNLAPSHQKYFSNWINSAKTYETKAGRIALSVNAMLNGLNYGEMIRAQKGKN